MRLLATLLFIATAGCSHLTVVRSEQPKAMTIMEQAEAGNMHTIKLQSFAWAFVPRKLPAESEVCPKSRMESVHLYQNAGDVWLAIVTAGIYVPYRADITCSLALNGSH